MRGRFCSWDPRLRLFWVGPKNHQHDLCVSPPLSCVLLIPKITSKTASQAGTSKRWCHPKPISLPYHIFISKPGSSGPQVIPSQMDCANMAQSHSATLPSNDMRFLAVTRWTRKPSGVNAKCLLLKHFTVTQNLTKFHTSRQKLPTHKWAEHMKVVDTHVKNWICSLKVNWVDYTLTLC